MTSRTSSLLRRLFSPCITVWSHLSQCFHARPGSDTDSTTPVRRDDVEEGPREPDDFEKSLHEQDDVAGILREQGDVAGGLREPNSIERGPRQPGDLEASPREDKENSTTPKRRALLVGISYKYSPSDRDGRKWEELDGHRDVEQFRVLLLNTYKFLPEDITVLKDDPDLPFLSQPTQANMLRELRRLVANAAPGDTFIFLYSGHSDQQTSYEDPDEEDGKDEVIITSDMQRIVDNDLNSILVKDLPVGCTFLAVLDTCHSGTMLDLPHYHCNDLYVPWLSKGERRTKTLQNRNVRANARGFTGTSDSASRRPTSNSIVSVISNRLHNDAPPPGPPLRVNVTVSSVSSTNQREASVPVAADRREARSPRRRSTASLVLSPTRQCTSPDGVRCGGCCEYDSNPRATVISLSACADPQRAWEGPRGSLTAVLCGFLETNPCPTYRTLMTHINLQLYENCRMLHEYTRTQKKKAAQGEGSGFDGELNDFQAPQLSSLAKLDMDDTLRLL